VSFFRNSEFTESDRYNLAHPEPTHHQVTNFGIDDNYHISIKTLKRVVPFLFQIWDQCAVTQFYYTIAIFGKIFIMCHRNNGLTVSTGYFFECVKNYLGIFTI
jgi:hypothetical protein